MQEKNVYFFICLFIMSKKGEINAKKQHVALASFFNLAVQKLDNRFFVDVHHFRMYGCYQL